MKGANSDGTDPLVVSTEVPWFLKSHDSYIDDCNGSETAHENILQLMI